MIKLNNFERSEFACPCCDANDMKDDFLIRLDRARCISNVPYVITSGYRCRRHNATLPRASNNSAHLRGYAADVLVASDEERWLILKGLMLAGFTRLGVYGGHIHVDSDPSLTPFRVWSDATRIAA